MNIDILKTFLSVARNKSFTKAAEENFCTQSTASLRIQALEDYFGIRLFDRIGKAVNLTHPGELVLPYIQLAVENFDQARESILQIRELSYGKISIIASQTPGTYIIPKILLDFHKRYPKISVSSQIAYAKSVIQEIANENRFDLGVISQPEHMITKYRSMNIDIEEICEDPLAIIVGENHLWADQGAITVSDLSNNTMFLSNQATSLISYLQHLTGAVIEEEKRIVMGNLESVKLAVQMGDGFSILSRFNIKEELSQGVIRAIKLKGYDLKRKICFISKKNKKFSPAVEKFHDSFFQRVENIDF